VSISESLNIFIVFQALFCSGFVEEGRARRYNRNDGKWSDLILMAILDEEWDTRRGIKLEVS
jgi:hypothetical protein